MKTAKQRAESIAYGVKGTSEMKCKCDMYRDFTCEQCIEDEIKATQIDVIDDLIDELIKMKADILNEK